MEKEKKLKDKSELKELRDAIKELTKQLVENTKTIAAMKKGHDKWIRAGKF